MLKTPKFIETIPKKGYQFLLKVELSKNTRKKYENKSLTLITISTLFLLLFISFYIFQNQLKDTIEIKSITPFTSSSHINYEISPDAQGENIAYVQKNRFR